MRTLHLVDVENLIGDGRPAANDVEHALAEYRAAVPFGAMDQVVVAANRHTAAMAGGAWPGVLVRAASGPDGADPALLADAQPGHVGRRFDRVVVASGDHIFTERIGELRAAGVRVEVVARPSSLALSLRLAADVVRLLPELTAPVAA